MVFSYLFRVQNYWTSFGVSSCVIVHDTSRAIITVMQKKYINFPADDDRCVEVARGFHSRWGILQCIGSIDGCHIPITDYYNRKGWYSIILQAIVDLFQDICVGWLGSVHDACVFKNSGVYNKVKNGNSFTINIRGMEVPYFIIGDSAYPLIEAIHT